MILVLRFMRSSDEGQGDIIAEIVMSPQHSKVFLLALQDNVQKFETVFGQINLEANQEAVKELQKTQT